MNKTELRVRKLQLENMKRMFDLMNRTLNELFNNPTFAGVDRNIIYNEVKYLYNKIEEYPTEKGGKE